MLNDLFFKIIFFSFEISEGYWGVERKLIACTWWKECALAQHDLWGVCSHPTPRRNWGRANISTGSPNSTEHQSSAATNIQFMSAVRGNVRWNANPNQCKQRRSAAASCLGSRSINVRYVVGQWQELNECYQKRCRVVHFIWQWLFLTFQAEMLTFIELFGKFYHQPVKRKPQRFEACDPVSR